MTDLNRLLELARKAKIWQDEQGAWVTMGMFAPLVVSNFIEKVQPQTIIGLIDALITLEARLRAAEEVVRLASHLIGEIPGPHPDPDVEAYGEALAAYDEAVKE